MFRATVLSAVAGAALALEGFELPDVGKLSEGLPKVDDVVAGLPEGISVGKFVQEPPLPDTEVLSNGVVDSVNEAGAAAGEAAQEMVGSSGKVFRKAFGSLRNGKFVKKSLRGLGGMGGKFVDDIGAGLPDFGEGLALGKLPIDMKLGSGFPGDIGMAKLGGGLKGGLDGVGAGLPELGKLGDGLPAVGAGLPALDGVGAGLPQLGKFDGVGAFPELGNGAGLKMMQGAPLGAMMEGLGGY